MHGRLMKWNSCIECGSNKQKIDEVNIGKKEKTCDSESKVIFTTNAERTDIFGRMACIYY